MKILDSFILKTYLIPFFRSFAVILFILALQFVSMYKDDLFGKGLDAWVLIRIFAYASVSMMVMAMPASVMMSSLLAMGNMGEYYELVAFRAGGIKLWRMLRPMIGATIFISLFSFTLSVYIVPEANLKFYSLIYDVKQVKPTFALQPGHFYNGIDGFTIRISDKNMAREMLYGIMIYDHRSKRGNDRLVLADSGSMAVREDGKYMRMTLYTGVSHESLPERGEGDDSDRAEVDDKFKALRHSRYYFDTLFYNFDLSGFGLNRTNEAEFATHHYMLNINQLAMGEDSIMGVQDYIRKLYRIELQKITRLDSSFKMLAGSDVSCHYTGEGLLTAFPDIDKSIIIATAVANARRIKEKTEKASELMAEQQVSLRNFQIEFHGKFSIPLACMVFLLIGAPLGSIIRKGGAGLPILISLIFYVFFYVVLVQGKKLAREGVFDPWMGVWMPVLTMVPIALFITYEATHDARILNARLWWQIGSKINAFLWYLNPVRFLIGLQFFRRILIAVLEGLISLNPATIVRRRRIRRQRGMRVTRGSTEEYMDRDK